MTDDDLSAIGGRFRRLQGREITDEVALVYAGQALIDVPAMLDEIRRLRLEVEVADMGLPPRQPTWRDIFRLARMWRNSGSKGD